MTHHRRTTCRLCQSANVELAFALEPSPLAEAYLPPDHAHEADVKYPSDVFLCRDCDSVQTLDIIDASALFRDYQWQSGMSPTMMEHFRQYAASVCERLKPATESLVVDIGSNDGSLLRQFKERGCRVHGVEPAWGIADIANRAGIPTTVDFMNTATAAMIRTARKAKVVIVTANNVLAHAEEPGVILDGVREVLADDGVFVFEVSYLPDLLDSLGFDWCYHEHGIFPTVGSYNALLHRHGLELFDVERIPTKGGSIRCFAHKLGKSFIASRLETMAKISGMIHSEKWLSDPHTYCEFIRSVNAARDTVQMYLREYRDRNLSVCGYGASATTTTLLHHFKIGGMLDYLVDANEKRWGLVSPGYRLEVNSPARLYGGGANSDGMIPDAVLITAWRYADEIIANHKSYLQSGGVFIVPLPTYREVTK